MQDDVERRDARGRIESGAERIPREDLVVEAGALAELVGFARGGEDRGGAVVAVAVLDGHAQFAVVAVGGSHADVPRKFEGVVGAEGDGNVPWLDFDGGEDFGKGDGCRDGVDHPCEDVGALFVEVGRVCQGFHRLVVVGAEDALVGIERVIFADQKHVG